MITYIELWKAKQAWVDLPQEERNNYLTGLGPAIQQLVDSGVQIVSWGINEASTYSRIDHDYFAVWNFPDIQAAHNFQQMVVDVGWYNYFEQTNAMGTASTPQEVLSKMMKIKEGALS